LRVADHQANPYPYGQVPLASPSACGKVVSPFLGNLVHHRNRDRSFPNRRRHTLHIPRPYILNLIGTISRISHRTSEIALIPFKAPQFYRFAPSGESPQSTIQLTIDNVIISCYPVPCSPSHISQRSPARRRPYPRFFQKHANSQLNSARNSFPLIHLQNTLQQTLSFDTSMHTPGYPLPAKQSRQRKNPTPRPSLAHYCYSSPLVQQCSQSGKHLRSSRCLIK
jgi:hypothetical protein